MPKKATTQTEAQLGQSDPQVNTGLTPEVPDPGLPDAETEIKAPDPGDQEGETEPIPDPMDQLKDTLIKIGTGYADKLNQGKTMNKEEIETLKALHELYTVLNVTPTLG
jgi:hypothetical protein